jgi:tetratricopeptide (TPR) repeat protein
MAQRTHYSKSLLGMVENGQRRATPDLVAAYERVLDARGLGEEVNRRELLAALAAMTAGATVPEPLSRLMDGLSSPKVLSRVGMSEVAAVRHATNVFTAMDQKFGGAVAAEPAMGALRWSVNLLDAAMTDDTRKALSSAVGALADRTAWAHYDMGSTYTAHRLLTLALRSADNGNDPDLRAHVMIDTASQIGKDEPAEAAEILDAALADNRVCGLEQANLNAVRARHLANSGDVAKALDHVQAAERLTERGGEVPQWATFLTVPHLEKLTTEALVAMGEKREAVKRFEVVLPRFGADRARAAAGVKISLAKLYVEAGRVDEARVLTGQAESDLTDVRSGKTARSLAELRGLLVRSGG